MSRDLRHDFPAHDLVLTMLTSQGLCCLHRGNKELSAVRLAQIHLVTNAHIHSSGQPLTQSLLCAKHWGIIQISHSPYSEHIHCSWRRDTKQALQHSVLYPKGSCVHTGPWAHRKTSLSPSEWGRGQRKRLNMDCLGVAFNSEPEQQYGKTWKQKGGPEQSPRG